SSGDKYGADTEAQAESNHPRQRAGRWPPASQLAGVVQLDLLRAAQVLPALAQEPQDFVHAARIGQTQADSTVEGVFADPDVVAVAAALEVDRSYEIDLVEFVGGSRLRPGVLLAWQERSEADPRCGQAVALQDARDGALAGQRLDAQRLEFRVDGCGSDEEVARGRGGVGLQPSADGDDRPFQFGRDTLREVVIGPGQVVQAFGSGLQVASPPLVEPGLGTAQRRANLLDSLAGEAETDGALTRREF